MGREPGNETKVAINSSLRQLGKKYTVYSVAVNFADSKMYLVPVGSANIIVNIIDGLLPTRKATLLIPCDQPQRSEVRTLQGSRFVFLKSSMECMTSRLRV